MDATITEQRAAIAYSLNSWQQALREYNAIVAAGGFVSAERIQDAEIEVVRLSKRAYVLQCQDGRTCSLPSALIR